MNAIAHSHFDLLSHSLSLILPIAYADTVPNASLIRMIDLGPFKHRVDDGLPLRKAAYQLLDTLIDTPHRIDIQEFIKVVMNGVKDEDDIAILTYQILYKLAVYHGAAFLQQIDEIPNLVMKGIRDKLKEAKGPDAAAAAAATAAASKSTVPPAAAAAASSSSSGQTEQAQAERAKGTHSADSQSPSTTKHVHELLIDVYCRRSSRSSTSVIRDDTN